MPPAVGWCGWLAPGLMDLVNGCAPRVGGCVMRVGRVGGLP